jgi:HAD superfamily hydrolase (TIGR01549 family)
MPMRRFRGVLLDVDGTLVDTVEAHALAWHEAFADRGFDVPVLQIRRLIGMGGDHLVEVLTGVDHESREFEKLSKAHEERFEAALPRLHGIVRAREFVLRLRAEGYHVVVASSAQGDKLDRLLALADVQDLLAERAAASDVERSKPDPDVIEAALVKLPIDRHHAVMIGDTPYDIEAARRANVATIAVASGGFANEALAGAIAVYRSVAELLAVWRDSPLG